ncbi:MAG: type II secretion system protein J [Nitrospinales bacterium]
MKRLKNPHGFTLLELIISITMIAVIIGIALGGMRLGISTRELGEQKADTYQRLRFIGEQISQNIKSLHPLFIKEKTEELFFEEQKNKQEPPKYLAFEGLPDSIRIITFANTLSMVKNPPWIHEVRFYLGAHPETRETGIIMMERDLDSEEAFMEVQSDSPGVHYIMLANEVNHLGFRYLKMTPIPPEELEQQEDPSIKYKTEWVDTIIIEPDKETQNPFFVKDEKTDTPKPENTISLPRAIEVSIGLKQPVVSSNVREPEIVYLPPMLIPLNSGIEFSRPPIEDEEEKKTDKNETT